MIPTPEQAWELLREYNTEEFHLKHGRTVGDVLRWFDRRRASAARPISGRRWAFSMIWTLSSGPTSTVSSARS